ncbi:MAG: glycoside hydrolase family 2, partial [Clostridia bacterium]|nr:glycoside hydrolase family 2 [Clostridia bacterium]
MFDLAYPNIQFERKKWISLNGIWNFYMPLKDDKVRTINVPYCPESEFSGLSEKGFINECIYERNFEAPERKENERIILRFGAVDYEAKVYVNGRYVGKHTGGYTPFSFDITDVTVAGENSLKVKVFDEI